ncbi:MAG: C40 family peptidase [Promicromonosporaceae bacterium]|nr:C40 family peptidase [Promicromonosporaceae bacterium]
MSSTTVARHRAARRPLTPTSIITAVTSGVRSETSRRTAVVATAGGLLMSAFGTGVALEETPADADTRLADLGLEALAAGALEALEASPELVIDARTQNQAETLVAAGEGAISVTPAPEPEPVVVRFGSVVARGADVPASAAGSAAVAIAARYVGTPYLFGGTTPAGFDCSGFTQYVFAQLGISLPRTSGQQRYAGTVISRADARPGDIVWNPGHVAIYAGDNMVIDSPRPGGVVDFRAIWHRNPVFIRIS